MPAEIPQLVQLVMDEYLALVQAAAPELLAGLYLHGSLALGAFDPRLSDIDFVAVTSRECGASEIQSLAAIHQTLAQRHPQARLEGSYLQAHDLGGSQETIPPRPYIHDGAFRQSGHFDINSVTWWVLKHHGVSLFGAPAQQLGIAVSWADLIAKMRENLNSYWASFTTNPRRMALLLSDAGIEWAVLGVLRQFYSFREHGITSKVGAGRYALEHTPANWHQLIREAISIREGTHTPSSRPRIARAARARAFLQWVIAACNSEG